MNVNRLRGIALLALSVGSFPVAAAAPQARPAVATGQAKGVVSFGLENSEVRRGYEAILAAIALVPAQTGQRAQYQAQIAYALDQTQLDCPTTLAALDIASRQPGLARATYGALRDVTTASARCASNGIAGVDGGPAGLLNNGPGVGFGGGSANYGG